MVFREFNLTSRWSSQSILSAALMAITGGALYLRLDLAGSHVLSTDEAHSWRIAQYPFQDIVGRTRCDAHPPLYYLILRAWSEAFGSSPMALRSLSALFSLAAVPLAFLACSAAQDLLFSERRRLPWSARWCCILAAILVAIHPSQAATGRVARMYALGIMLAALSSWLILEFLRDTKGRLVWVLGYSGSALALIYTHYYGFFVLAAQALFAGAFSLLRREDRPLNLFFRRLTYLFSAYIIVGVLYMPWMAAFMRQVDDVRTNFWLPEQLTFSDVLELFLSWLSGVPQINGLISISWLVMFALAIAGSRRSAGAWFFMLQCLLPWGLAIAASLYLNREVLLSRYLIFAHWALLLFWASVSSLAEGLLWKSTISGLLVLSAAFGCNCLSLRHDHPLPIQALQQLKQQCRPSEQLWTETMGQLNLFRYCAAQIGFSELSVKCPSALAERTKAGHVVYLASFSAEDFVEPDPKPPRFWSTFKTASETHTVTAHIKGESEPYTLYLYEQKASE